MKFLILIIILISFLGLYLLLDRIFKKRKETRLYDLGMGIPNGKGIQDQIEKSHNDKGTIITEKDFRDMMVALSEMPAPPAIQMFYISGREALSCSDKMFIDLWSSDRIQCYCSIETYDLITKRAKKLGLK